MRRLTDWIVPQFSYAQSGEDVIIDVLLESVNVYRPTYLELGTNHPRMGNNTYKFYRKGGKGVLVEADPTLIRKIKRLRPRDKVLNVGVSASDAKNARFHVFERSSLNTFDENEARLRQQKGVRIKEIMDIPLKTINEILEDNFLKVPHFMSIDIEGLDLAVLKSLDWKKYPIPIICVETCLYSNNHIRPQDKEVTVFMESVGYFPYANTYINTIFVNKNWFENPS
jgi:FkbM family methyltransferase